MAKPYVIQNLNAKGGVVSAEMVGSLTDPNAVSYNEQPGRTDAEKETARENIGLNGSVSAADVAGAIGDMTAEQAAQALEDLGGEPVTVTVTVSGSAVDITPEADHEYECGELVSLTISDPPPSGKYYITFFSGSTPTATVGIGNFIPKANKRYQIVVKNNYAKYDSWDWEGV